MTISHDYTIIHDCDSTTGITTIGDANISVNSSNFIQGSGGLNIYKSGTTQTTFGIEIAFPEVTDLRQRLIVFWLYVKDRNVLNNLISSAKIELVDVNDKKAWYNFKQDLTSGWNKVITGRRKFSYESGFYWNQVTKFRIVFDTYDVSQTVSEGDIVVDYILHGRRVYFDSEIVGISDVYRLLVEVYKLPLGWKIEPNFYILKTELVFRNNSSFSIVDAALFVNITEIDEYYPWIDGDNTSEFIFEDAFVRVEGPGWRQGIRCYNARITKSLIHARGIELHYPSIQDSQLVAENTIIIEKPTYVRRTSFTANEIVNFYNWDTRNIEMVYAVADRIELWADSDIWNVNFMINKINIGTRTVRFHDCKFLQAWEYQTGYIYEYYTLDVLAHDGTSPVSGALVEVYDVNNNLVVSGGTDASGKFTTELLVRYTDANGTVNYGPFTIKVTKEGYIPFQITYNITEKTEMLAYLPRRRPVISLLPFAITYQRGEKAGIICQVTDMYGIPITDATVEYRLLKIDGTEVIPWTQMNHISEGVYAIELDTSQLDVGVYIVQFRATVDTVTVYGVDSIKIEKLAENIIRTITQRIYTIPI